MVILEWRDKTVKLLFFMKNNNLLIYSLNITPPPVNEAVDDDTIPEVRTDEDMKQENIPKEDGILMEAGKKVHGSLTHLVS